MAELKRLLNDGCVVSLPEQDPAAFAEQVAMCDEQLLNSYLEQGSLDDAELAAAIGQWATFSPVTLAPL